MNAKHIPFWLLADHKHHYVQGWAVRHNPAAKTFPFTAWRYAAPGRGQGVKAKTRVELLTKINNFGTRLVRGARGYKR